MMAQLINNSHVQQRKIYNNPFFNYLVDFKEEMKEVKLSQRTLFAEAGRRWRHMSNYQKRPYIEIAANIKKNNYYISNTKTSATSIKNKTSAKQRKRQNVPSFYSSSLSSYSTCSDSSYYTD